MKPTVVKNKCNGCGTCLDVCPMDVFELNEKAEVKNADECIGCRACELQCPEQAITISD